MLMINDRKKQKGFMFIWIILAVIVIAGILFAVINQWNTHNSSGNLIEQITGEDNKSKNAWLADCDSDDRKPMTNLPMNIDDVETISPYGLTAGAHVTPIDHLYIYPKKSPRDKYPVYAMADGFIVEIGSRGVMIDTGEERLPEYRIIFQHSCQTVSYFDLVTKLDRSLLDKIGQLEPNEVKNRLRIPVKAGQEIGRIGGQSLDTAVYNFSMTLPGFIHPKLYESEFWKVHTDDFFSYFSQENQDLMQAKNYRRVKPYSGKIDYDQPGKLIGNWFKTGTNGYAGPKESQNKSGPNGYWTGHLAIFYDAIDPSIITVSFGNYQGEPKAFAVKNNSPDPANISTDSGVVKYELVAQKNNFFSGSTPSNIVEGTVLFQVLGGERLKMELFPNKTANEVSKFTTSALTYER